MGLCPASLTGAMGQKTSHFQRAPGPKVVAFGVRLARVGAVRVQFKL